MRARGVLGGLALALVLGCARPEPPVEVTYWYLRD